MKREDYEYAKNKNPDWDRVVSQDIKTWSKLYIFDSILARREYETIIKKIERRIDDFVSLIDADDVKAKYKSDLTEYAQKTYQWTMEHFGKFTPYLLSLAVASTKTLTPKQIDVVATQGAFIIDLGNVNVSRTVLDEPLKDYAYSTGVSANAFYRDVHKQVKQQMKELAELEIKPTYYANVNPRNIAEMNVRFNVYKENKQAFLNRGVSLVYVRPHSNCSKRCQPYQGKLYSLDGTSGFIDGRKYIPIEEVADNQTYVSNNTGKTYYCGLFSYNCRHTMEEYKRGMQFERIPDDVIERQRRVEMHQREMERNYRSLREKSELYYILYHRSGNKDVQSIARSASVKAATLRKEYITYSKKHNVPYYPTRLQILEGENRYVRTSGKKDGFAKQALKLKNEG